MFHREGKEPLEGLETSTQESLPQLSRLMAEVDEDLSADEAIQELGPVAPAEPITHPEPTAPPTADTTRDPRHHPIVDEFALALKQEIKAIK